MVFRVKERNGNKINQVATIRRKMAAIMENRKNGHISSCIHDRRLISVSNVGFSGSRNAITTESSQYMNKEKRYYTHGVTHMM